MHESVIIDELVSIKYPERLSIAANSYIGRGSMIQASGYVDIGRDVLIGPYVKIWSSSHRFDKTDIPIHYQGHHYSKVRISDDVWIGVGAIILMGVTIGQGAVVGAGSVVTRDVPELAVVIGNPARVLKYRVTGDASAGTD